MTDRFGYGVPRAFACVVRNTSNARELLVFRHPTEGLQIPKGRIDHDETPVVAACRELEEESGLSLHDPRYIATIDRHFPHPETGERIEEQWHCFSFEPESQLADGWIHYAEEEDMVFEYFWTAIDTGLAGRLHPYFAPVADVVRAVSSMFLKAVRRGLVQWLTAADTAGRRRVESWPLADVRPVLVVVHRPRSYGLRSTSNKCLVARTTRTSLTNIRSRRSHKC